MKNKSARDGGNEGLKKRRREPEEGTDFWEIVWAELQPRKQGEVVAILALIRRLKIEQRFNESHLNHYLHKLIGPPRILPPLAFNLCVCYSVCS